MKLEVGKTYRSRCGSLVKIIGRDDHELYPFDAEDGDSYTDEGKYYHPLHETIPELMRKEHCCDLIEEAD